MNKSEKSIDDILASIKNVMEHRKSSPVSNYVEYDEDDELELTEEFQGQLEEVDIEQGILSHVTKLKTEAVIREFVETADTLGQNNMVHDAEELENKEQVLETLIMNLLRPHMKEWLDQNLPYIVKQTVSQEIKSLVSHIQKNKNNIPA